MANRIFIDTSAFVALFNESDKYHEQTRKFFKTLEGTRTLLITSDYIVDETVTAIMSRSNHTNACTFLDQLQTFPMAIIPIFPVYFYPAQRLFRRFKDKDFSFTDCTSFTYMQGHEVSTAITFDKHFSQMGFRVLP